jgi:hypothetical protein
MLEKEIVRIQETKQGCAEFTKEEFREKWDKKYPNILKSWDKNWAELTTFFCIPGRDSQDNIHDECCRGVPPHGAKVYEVEIHLPDR